MQALIIWLIAIMLIYYITIFINKENMHSVSKNLKEIDLVYIGGKIPL